MFQDAYALSAIATFPTNPGLFVTANSAGLLRATDLVKGRVVQKLNKGEEVRALCLDYGGEKCPMSPFTGEISYRCCTGSQKYF